MRLLSVLVLFAGLGAAIAAPPPPPPPPLAVTSPTNGGTASGYYFYSAGTCNPADGTVIVTVVMNIDGRLTVISQGNASVNPLTGDWTYEDINLPAGVASMTAIQPQVQAVSNNVAFLLSRP